MTSEFALIEQIGSSLPGAPLAGEVWIGDDAAVLHGPEPGWMLLAADAVVGGVHADLSLTTLADFGWRAMAACISDIAAMGGEVGHAVVTVSAPAGTDIPLLYEGIAEASAAYGCPVVGGDITEAGALVVSVAVTGRCEARPVLRSGASAGDVIWVTGPLGAAAAGLRLHLAGPGSSPAAAAADALLQAHARPRARLAEGRAARLAGATAMIDVSDGLAADLGHIAERSSVGLRLESVPVQAGATVDDALYGGDDLVLAFTAPESADVPAAFSGLDTPIAIGRCTNDPGERTLDGRPLAPGGWEHRL